MEDNCKCWNCDCETQLCKYKCELDGYNLYDINDIYIKKIYDYTNVNDIDNNIDDPELDIVSNVEYCQKCNNLNEYPNTYDNSQKKFLNNNNEMLYYSNFLKNNIIHNFNSIECDHCSSILNKGKFTIENVENFDNSSFPNDYIKNIKLFNLEGSFVKEFEPNDYQEYRSLTDEYTTDISKNVLYCNTCNFVILNSLRKIFR